jgi:hypothetical protein
MALRLRPLRSAAAIFLGALVISAVACALPDDPYQRWQLLDGTIHANARWIFERIHFDPTPIDVAIVGPSRTQADVDAPRLAAELKARGLPDQIVNFSLPEAGRNINALIVEEVLKAKHPELIIVGVTEKPSRFGHPAFKFLAPAGDVVAPGYWSDANYFSDLIYLPYRQVRLFGADMAPGPSGLSKSFDPARYAGPSIDTTGDVHLPDGTVKDGHDPASHAELMRGVRKLEHGAHRPLLSRTWADVEFGDERFYIRRICDLAKAHGAKVAFLFLPYYTGPDALQERSLYEGCGPVWDAGFLAPRADWYMDYGHLTRTGADHLTDWLAGPVTTALSASAPAGETRQ